MALVLGTVLKTVTSGGNSKEIPWGTPYEKLTKAEREYARDNNLLLQVPDLMPTIEEELAHFDDQASDDEDLIETDQTEDPEAE